MFCLQTVIALLALRSAGNAFARRVAVESIVHYTIVVCSKRIPAHIMQEQHVYIYIYMYSFAWLHRLIHGAIQRAPYVDVLVDINAVVALLARRSGK